mmetsp:Transcript_43757/g.133143  ORF Transcript_43757/g.133143 Transcript_43757/m.133143 type:complete len:256 (-) Transcript_43757:2662-3429(-)
MIPLRLDAGEWHEHHPQNPVLLTESSPIEHLDPQVRVVRLRRLRCCPRLSFSTCVSASAISTPHPTPSPPPFDCWALQYARVVRPRSALPRRIGCPPHRLSAVLVLPQRQLDIRADAAGSSPGRTGPQSSRAQDRHGQRGAGEGGGAWDPVGREEQGHLGPRPGALLSLNGVLLLRPVYVVEDIFGPATSHRRPEVQRGCDLLPHFTGEDGLGRMHPRLPSSALTDASSRRQFDRRRRPLSECRPRGHRKRARDI